MVLMIAFCSLQVVGQGVDFQSITLREALERAKTENKLVFIDCYAEWSVPCKQMDQQVFSLPEAGTFFNPSFVNLRIDMEKGEGAELAARFGVKSFPAYLLLTADGKLRQKASGAVGVKQLIQVVKNGMNYETSTSWFDDQYAAGKRDEEFLRNYLMIILNVYRDNDLAGEVAGEFLAILSPNEKISTKGWIIYGNGQLTPVGSTNFAFLVNNREKFESQLTKKVVDETIEARLNEAVVPYLTGQILRTTKPAEALLVLDSIQTEVNRLLSGDKALNVKIEMARARCTGKVPELLDLLEKNYELLNSRNDISVIYYYCLVPILERVPQEQRSRIFSIWEKSLEAITDLNFKRQFVAVLDELKPRFDKK